MFSSLERMFHDSSYILHDSSTWHKAKPEPKKQSIEALIMIINGECARRTSNLAMFPAPFQEQMADQNCSRCQAVRHVRMYKNLARTCEQKIFPHLPPSSTDLHRFTKGAVKCASAASSSSAFLSSNLGVQGRAQPQRSPQRPAALLPCWGHRQPCTGCLDVTTTRTP